MESKDCFQLDTQVPFPIQQFTEYDQDNCRLDFEATDQFFKRFVPEFGLSLYGVDIIVDARD